MLPASTDSATARLDNRTPASGRRHASASFIRFTSAPALTQASAVSLVSGRRLALIQRHAELLHRADERLRIVDHRRRSRAPR
jgi:hypothetical protein